MLGFVKRYLSKDRYLYQAIKNIFGFYPENIFVYKLAFRHKSAAQESLHGIKVCNERLEFLGDAILGSIIAEYLFKKYPCKDEGYLTEMRSKIVNRQHLNRLSEKIGIKDLILLGNDQVISAGSSIQGDAFEAFIGALYIDKGYKFTRKIILHRLLKCYVDLDELLEKETNYKSRLIEWAQKEKKSIQFNVIKETINGNGKLYDVEILIDSISVITATDSSIKKAEQKASEKFVIDSGILQ